MTIYLYNSISAHVTHTKITKFTSMAQIFNQHLMIKERIRLFNSYCYLFQGDGLFAVNDIESNTIIAQFGGYRMNMSQYLPSEMSTHEQYRHFIGLGK